MTAPLFLLDDLSLDLIVLGGAEGRHAATVRRVRVGEAVDLADGRGARAHCTVAGLGRDTVQLRVVSRTVEPELSPRLVLVQAIAKGDRGELAVELATEVGIDEIIPWSAERCVVQWEGVRGVKALARWQSTAREAGKQSRRAWLPVVSSRLDTPALLSRLTGATALVLHEPASAPLARVALPAAGEVLLVVGPEGGITDRELAELVAAGGQPVRLGSSILRTSTAGAAAACVVSARTARWS